VGSPRAAQEPHQKPDRQGIRPVKRRAESITVDRCASTMATIEDRSTHGLGARSIVEKAQTPCPQTGRRPWPCQRDLGGQHHQSHGACRSARKTWWALAWKLQPVGAGTFSSLCGGRTLRSLAQLQQQPPGRTAGAGSATPPAVPGTASGLVLGTRSGRGASHVSKIESSGPVALIETSPEGGPAEVVPEQRKAGLLQIACRTRRITRRQCSRGKPRQARSSSSFCRWPKSRAAPCWWPLPVFRRCTWKLRTGGGTGPRAPRLRFMAWRDNALVGSGSARAKLANAGLGRC